MTDTLAALDDILDDITTRAARLDTPGIEAAHERLSLLVNDFIRQGATRDLTLKLRERLEYYRDLCRFLSDSLGTAIRGSHGLTVAYERSGSLRVETARRTLAPR